MIKEYKTDQQHHENTTPTGPQERWADAPDFLQSTSYDWEEAWLKQLLTQGGNQDPIVRGQHKDHLDICSYLHNCIQQVTVKVPHTTKEYT